MEPQPGSGREGGREGYSWTGLSPLVPPPRAGVERSAGGSITFILGEEPGTGGTGGTGVAVAECWRGAAGIGDRSGRTPVGSAGRPASRRILEVRPAPTHLSAKINTTLKCVFVKF